ncbi:MAG: PfkB family carbohydrate kinase [Chthoniobacteraceae bacterium]
MNPERFDRITEAYAGLRIAVVGDYCLDRYLEIDPARPETSIETGLAVHNVVNVRAQPGAAGTVLNNLVALGVGTIFAVGFCGEDGEGFELRRALGSLAGVNLDHFLTTPLRRTFTYCKPLVLEHGAPPRELNRLDSKNWTPTPRAVAQRIVESLVALRSQVDAVIVMDQVDAAGTGVITPEVLPVLGAFPRVIADSRRGLRDYPPVIFKMNAAELRALTGREADESGAARELAGRNGRPVFVTMAERGIVGAEPGGTVEHVPALPLRGPIDVVGAGDSVTANLAAALAAGATTREAIEMAITASSLVIHQLGTTGTASVELLRALAVGNAAALSAR